MVPYCNYCKHFQKATSCCTYHKINVTEFCTCDNGEVKEVLHG